MEDIIKLHDKKFRIMIPAAKIDEAVAAVACRINEDYRDKPTPLFVGVLNGSFMFMSDLIKKIEFNNELSFVKLASYEGTCSTGCVKNLIGLNNSIEGRHVIIVEDIVDTGESIEHMIGELKSHNPASIEVCTLFFKPGSYRKQLPISFKISIILHCFHAHYLGRQVHGVGVKGKLHVIQIVDQFLVADAETDTHSRHSSGLGKRLNDQQIFVFFK